MLILGLSEKIRTKHSLTSFVQQTQEGRFIFKRLLHCKKTWVSTPACLLIEALGKPEKIDE